MRILSVFATFAVGGPQVRFAALANHFGDEFRHDVIAMDGNLAARERLAPGLDLRFPDAGLIKGDTLGNIRRIRAFLRREKPDLLVTNNWGSIEWALANAIRPLVRHIHIEDGFGPEERARQIPRRVWTRRLVLRRSRVILPSQVLLGIARDVWRLPERNLLNIPNGIDIARFPPASGSKASGSRDGVAVIGTVAAMRAEKNIGRLLEAFHLLPDDLPARLVIVGDGPMLPELRNRAVELGIADRVSFTGHRDNPVEALAAFDIFALSSDTEQMPISLLEAMASALPIAATAVGDVARMVCSANLDYVVRPTSDALADSLARLLADPGMRRRIGDENRLRAERDFSDLAMFTAYRAAFQASSGQS